MLAHLSNLYAQSIVMSNAADLMISDTDAEGLAWWGGVLQFT